MRRWQDQVLLRQVDALWDGGAAAGLTDGQLLERFASGRGAVSEFAFAALVEKHGPMVQRVCHRILRDAQESEDALQATFLVLALGGRSLWVRNSLGPWLHRVAIRVAVRARAKAQRRRAAERRAARPEDLPGGDEGLSDLGRVLDEEIDRLPGRFRAAIVLCDVQGLTHEQAARHLGCPVGTVKSRLARGRERLRHRLTRRGVAPHAGAIAPAFSAFAAEARGRAALSDSIACTAARVAAGDGMTPGMVRASVRDLTEGVMTAMRLKMIIGACGLLLAIGIAASGSLLRGAPGPRGPAADPSGPVIRGDAQDPKAAEPAAPGSPGAGFSADADLQRLEYEVRKDLLRDAMRQEGQLELRSILGGPAVEGPAEGEDNAAREKDDARRYSEARARERLQTYVKKLKDSVLSLGKEIEEVDARHRKQREARPLGPAPEF